MISSRCATVSASRRFLLIMRMFVVKINSGIWHFWDHMQMNHWRRLVTFPSTLMGNSHGFQSLACSSFQQHLRIGKFSCCTDIWQQMEIDNSRTTFFFISSGERQVLTGLTLWDAYHFREFRQHSTWSALLIRTIDVYVRVALLGILWKSWNLLKGSLIEVAGYDIRSCEMFLGISLCWFLIADSTMKAWVFPFNLFLLGSGDWRQESVVFVHHLYFWSRFMLHSVARGFYCDEKCWHLSNKTVRFSPHRIHPESSFCASIDQLCFGGP